MADRKQDKSSSSIVSSTDGAVKGYDTITASPPTTSPVTCTEQEKLDAMERKLIRKIDLRYVLTR